MKKGALTGLFFGSFNPIHIGHMILAEYMVEHTDISEVWFVVSPQNPLKEKKGLLADYHRLAMVNIAVEDDARMLPLKIMWAGRVSDSSLKAAGKGQLQKLTMTWCHVFFCLMFHGAGIWDLVFEGLLAWQPLRLAESVWDCTMLVTGKARWLAAKRCSLVYCATLGCCLRLWQEALMQRSSCLHTLRTQIWLRECCQIKWHRGWRGPGYSRLWDRPHCLQQA